MRWNVILVLVALSFTQATTLEIEISGGPEYSVGSWGQYFGTGISFGGCALWKASQKLGAGLALDGNIYSSNGSSDASLSILSTEAVCSFFLRPGARSFNPGLIVAIGLSKSVLSSGSGTDPATWDPSWRAGFRWGFNIGAGFRGRFGFDFGSIISSESTGDYFGIRLGVLREVEL